MAFLIIAPPPPPLLPSFHCAVTSRLRLLYITSVSSCVSTVCLPVCEDQQAVTLQPTQPGNTRKQEIDLFLRCCTWCGFFRGNRRRKKKGGREAGAGGRQGAEAWTRTGKAILLLCWFGSSEYVKMKWDVTSVLTLETDGGAVILRIWGEFFSRQM